MGQDFLPRPDGQFLTWMETFLTYAQANTAALGLLPADLTPLATARTDWQTAYLDNDAKQNAAQAARQLKDDRRKALETAVRTLVRRLQASSQVSDDERAALGITVRDGIMTAATAAATRPVAIVSTAQRLRHEIKFFDEATPTRRAKPAGVLGCEIWVIVLPPGVAPPTDPCEYKFLTLDTASPYLAEYSGDDANKIAYYLLRWATASGEKGPWSETVAATIAG